VLGQVHRPHPALPELLADDVRPEPEPAVLARQDEFGLERREQPVLDEHGGRLARVVRQVGDFPERLVEPGRLVDAAAAEEVDELGRRGRGGHVPNNPLEEARRC
jgi:hypothetical protein